MVDYLIIWWTLFAIIWIIASFSVKRTQERQSSGRRLVTVGFLTLTVLLLCGKIHGLNRHILPQSALLYWTGELIAFIGFLTTIAARYYLGRNWSGSITFKEDHELVQQGPYRLVRHPIYSGLLMMILGTALVVGRVSSLTALFVFFAGTWHKLRQEEVLMLKHFPGSYSAYMSRTKAIIPFVL